MKRAELNSDSLASERAREGFIKAYNELNRSKEMSDALNRVAEIFLSGSSGGEESFDDMMTVGMGLIADMAELDRLNLWRNSLESDGLHTSQIYRWDRASGGTTVPTAELADISFADFAPGWEDVLLSGESINSPARLLQEKDLFSSYGAISVFITPIFIKEVFWGFVLFSDHRNERFFDEYTSEMLRSAAFLCANAVIREEMEREINKANRLNRSMLENMPVGMILFSGDPPQIIDCNNELTRMFKAPKEQIIKDYFTRFMPEHLEDGNIAVKEALMLGAKAMSGETIKVEWLHLTADGVEVPCEVTLIRVKDEEDFIGLGFLYDMTEIRKREKELIKAQERNELQLTKLNLAIKAARIGLWDMEVVRDDPVNNVNIIIWSDDFRELLGYTDEIDFPNVISSFHNCLHPDDFDRVTKAISDHMLDTTGKTPYGVEYRVFKKNGDLAYIRATGETIRDKDGNPLRVAGTIMDITEEKNTLYNTEKLRMQAEEANKAKSAFLANMSHEIRTPLNAVIGLSDLILATDDLNAESRYRLEQINNAGATLLGTVNDILDISKIEAGKFELVPGKYDIPSMINDAVSQSILQRGEKPIEFKMDVCENLPTHLYGDELRIKQILNNLLSNAFKYTMKGTVELSVKCSREGDIAWLTFVVSDTGIGIRKEDMVNLFSDYVQMDVSANRKIIGTGLGLSITHRLAELMGGNISAQSEYGRGSVFTVNIQQQSITGELIGPEVIKSLKCLSYSEHKRLQVGALARINLPYARVLIVDDVITNLDVAQGLMKPYNMQIDCVTGGFDAVEAMHDESVRYNAIFMDHMMPGMDGVEATRLIREIDNDYARNIPIIALTANAIVGTEEMFLSKGFQAFISKPIEINRLDAVIREWVRDKEQEKLLVNQENQDASRYDGSTYAPFNITVPGIDVEKGIVRFGGDKDSYLSVLQSFAKNTRPLLDSLVEKSKDKSLITDYETIVHGVKGSGSAIFAHETADLAEVLEKAAKLGDYEFVKANNAALVKVTETIIDNIEKMLDKIKQEAAKPKKDKPDKATLIRLRDACADYEMNAVDDAITKLEEFDYEVDNELVVWLRKHIEQTDFDEIVERLASIKS